MPLPKRSLLAHKSCHDKFARVRVGKNAVPFWEKTFSRLYFSPALEGAFLNPVLRPLGRLQQEGGCLQGEYPWSSIQNSASNSLALDFSFFPLHWDKNIRGLQEKSEVSLEKLTQTDRLTLAHPLPPGLSSYTNARMPMTFLARAGNTNALGNAL